MPRTLKLEKLLFIVILMMAAFEAKAQTAGSTPWWVEAQAGASYTFGEGSFFKMLSPAVNLSAGYRFSRPIGLRLGVGGYEGKGFVIRTGEYYRYQFVRPALDLMWHPFPKLNNLYVFAGAGVMIGVGNGATKADVSFRPDYFQDLWTPAKAFMMGRVGAGYVFPVGKSLSVTAEAVYSLMPDAINSKHGSTPDASVALMAGLRYAFGAKAQKAVKAPKAPEAQVVVEPVVEPAPAPVEEAKPVEEVVEEVVEEDPVVVEEAVEVEEVEVEEVEVKADEPVEEVVELPAPVKIYFDSNSWKVREEYGGEVEKMAAFLKEHPGVVLTLTAYADSAYGTPSYNQTITERRVRAVRKALLKAGVPESQLEEKPMGGTDIFSKGKKISGNRVVICEWK